jgi:hypothetical protein
MRKRRRLGLLLALAAALGVGLIAFPASAAALPPTVPTCTPKPSTGSDSCVRGTVTAIDGSLGPNFENIRLGTRVRTTLQSGSETMKVIIRYDDDGQLNLASVPGTCTAAQLSGDTIAQAYAQCGPGPGGSNTYLSPPGNVSGVGSTVVAGIDACTMIFKGANNNQVLIWARSPIGNPPSECNNPATNSGGSATTVFTGTITQQPPASPYGPTLNVPNTNSPPIALDDFSAVVARGAAFRARCRNPMKVQAVFDYVPANDPNDTISPPYPGTQDNCPP